MHSKTKGDITETIVLAELTKRLIPVSIPFGDNQRYDLIADFNGNLLKIQCKTGRFDRGCVIFQARSSTIHTTNGKHESYQGQIDLFGVYCPKLETSYLVPICNFPNINSIALRIEEPLIHYQRIIYAKDYTFDKQVPLILNKYAELA